jgi:hypothetical protein
MEAVSMEALYRRQSMEIGEDVNEDEDIEVSSTIENLGEGDDDEDHRDLFHTFLSKAYERCCWCLVVAMTLVVLLGIVGFGIVARNSGFNNNHNHNNYNNQSSLSSSPTSATTDLEETIIPFDSLEEYYDHVLDVIRLSPSTVTDIRHWTDPTKSQYEALQFLIYHDTSPFSTTTNHHNKALVPPPLYRI